ncbi:MAG: hypothetical protein JWP08_3811 [Bryobacterales bacterium]|nr:hypothetical protein [Bryobacterales bacterium]
MSGPNEAQWPVGALRDAHARRGLDTEIRCFAPAPDGQFAFVETRAVLCAGDRQSLRQLARPVSQTGCRTFPVPALVHSGKSRQRFDRSDQDAACSAFRLGHHVQAFVHAVDEIDVSTARRTEDDLGALCEAPGRVRGEVAFPEVGFGFHNHPGSVAMDEHATQEIARKVDCGPLKKGLVGGFRIPDQPLERYRLKRRAAVWRSLQVR